MEKITLNCQGRKFSLSFNQHFSNLLFVNQSLNVGAFNHYQKSGLTYVDVPAIVGITGACENVDTLFKIGNRLDLPLFFTQTGQLALEQALKSNHGVYTVIHSGRDEEEEDERHLRQFRLTEEEFDCTFEGMNRENYDEEKMFSALLSHIQLTVKSMIKEVLKKNEKILVKFYHRDVDRLYKSLEIDFYQISYEEAIKIINKIGKKNLEFGDDLKAEDEALIVKYLNKINEEIPVFITRYPKEIKFFNMKVSSINPRVVLSADLIFPYAGEGTGSAVREHDFERLNERLISSTMFKLHLERGGKYEDFSWYLNIIKNNLTFPHAGYGIGNERVLQYIFGAKDIRHVSLFSLFNEQTGDWDVSRYGKQAILTAHKKHILLTIGKESDKKLLGPYIKKIAVNPNYVLYATEKTHLFLKKQGVKTALVYKISQIGKSPNLADLLNRRLFDLIINIPRRENGLVNKKEFTDGKLIRKRAVANGVYLVTDVEVAIDVLTNLAS